VLLARLLHRRLDAEPVAHQRDLAERDAGLRHAERARVHAEEQHALSGRGISPQVQRVALACVLERVVDVAHGRSEAQARERAGQIIGRPEQALYTIHAALVTRRSCAFTLRTCIAANRPVRKSET
jgi:hypothetical protein